MSEKCGRGHSLFGHDEEYPGSAAVCDHCVKWKIVT